MLRNIRSTLVGSPVVAILLAALVLLAASVPGAAEPTAAGRTLSFTNAVPGLFSKTGTLVANRDRADAEPTPPPAPRVIREGNSSLKRVGRPVDLPADACFTGWRLPAPRVGVTFHFPTAPAPRVVHRRIRHALVLRGPPSIA
jgi:hypothetical protein